MAGVADGRMGGLRRAMAAGLVLLVAGGLAGGCATIKRAREAQDPARAPAGERTVRAADIGLTSNTVLTLDEALRVALAWHPSVIQASQNVVAATAAAGETRAAYWPGLSAGAGYTRATGNTAASRGDNRSHDSYSGSLNLDLLVYDFGKTPAAVREAVARLIAAQENYRAARSDAAYGVRAAFYDLSRADGLLQVSEDAVRQFEQHLEQARTFLEVGTRIQYDVTKAEVDLGNARLSRITARNGVETSRAVLNRSLGMAEDPGYRLGAGPLQELARSLDDLMKEARERHPGLQALKAGEQAASAAVDAAIADLYPSLQVQGRVGESGSKFPLVWNWSAALQSAWDLFTGWRKTGAVDEAVARLRAARASAADREQQIYLDLRRAVGDMDSARQRRDLSDLIVRQTKESLALVDQRYRLGKASAIEVTDAQVAVTQAQSDQIKARADYETAAAQIRHAIGEE